MQEEDVVLIEEEDSPMEEVELLIVMKRAIVRRLRDKLIRKETPEVEGHTSEEEVMAEAEEIPSSVTSVTNGDTGLLNVLKMNQLDRGEHMLLNLMKQRQHHKKWRMCLKQDRPWC